jgi:hypothetical protein
LCLGGISHPWQGLGFGRGFLELENIMLYSEEMEKNLLWHAQATSKDKFMCICVLLCVYTYARTQTYMHIHVYVYRYI